MKLIAFRPTDDPEIFHLWYLSRKGYITRTLKNNVFGLRSMLMTAKSDGVELFGTDYSPTYITNLLKERYKSIAI
jgi:hypothetical protein